MFSCIAVLLFSGIVYQIERTPPAQPESEVRITAGSGNQSAEPDSKKLVATKIQKADYPRGARDGQLQGRVIVRMYIATSGDVEKVEPVSGDATLAKAAVAAAKQWKFKPYFRNGKPVRVTTDVPFDFAFDEKVSDRSLSDSDPTRSESPGVALGRLVHRVEPVYPWIAKHRAIMGSVVLKVIIAKDGQVQSVKPVSGPKELIEAAIGAVQQWRYEPSMAAGQAVEAETTVTINFRL